MIDDETRIANLIVEAIKLIREIWDNKYPSADEALANKLKGVIKDAKDLQNY